MQTHKNSRSRERRAMRAAIGENLGPRSIVDVDPEDPSQLLDEAGQFSVEELAVEAQPSTEANDEIELARAMSAGEEELDENNQLFDSEVEEAAVELDTPPETTADAYAEAAEDTGELYGVHTPKASDPDLDQNPDRESFKDAELGETWLETLEKKATEDGAEAEREIVIIDDSDEHRGHSPTSRRDRPVADKGSGGSGGL